MRQKKEKSRNFSYRKTGVVLVAFLAMIIVVIILNMNQKSDQVPQLKPPIVHRTPTNMPTPTLDPNKSGFQGYEKSQPWFDFALPPECTTEKTKQTFGYLKKITCITNTFTVIITPEAGRGEVESTEIKDIKINQNIWTRFILAKDPEYSSLYQLNAHENTYLIGVHYQPFTKQAQTYFETILGSFHFID